MFVVTYHVHEFQEVERYFYIDNKNYLEYNQSFKRGVLTEINCSKQSHGIEWLWTTVNIEMLAQCEKSVSV